MHLERLIKNKIKGGKKEAYKSKVGDIFEKSKFPGKPFEGFQEGIQF